MYSEPNARIFLNHVRGIGPMGFQRLLQLAGSARDVFRWTPADLHAAGIPLEVAGYWVSQWQNPKLIEEVEQEWRRLDDGEFKAITELDADYPDAFRELVDRPPVLYVKGVWPPPPGLPIGIVGTRRASSYGLMAAECITAELVRRHVLTVSGLAKGIDAVAHRVTLEEGGWTAAALGHGFKFRYPPENGSLYDDIAEHGALLTEFPYEQRPDAGNFPRRNRLISGLARGVVVIEANARSGALITARYAAEQNRDVFAVPGNIFDATSAGCHRLIKDGATLVQSAEDILQEYESEAVRAPDHTDPGRNESALTTEEKLVLKALSSDAKTIDELCVLCAQPIDRLMSTLLSLELNGIIKGLPGQQYAAKKR